MLLITIIICLTIIVSICLFTKCKHSYEIIEDLDIIGRNGNCKGKFYSLKCSKCGKIKFKKYEN